MALFDELQSASFKGVSFLVESTTTNAGRKTVTHEYPNTNIRFVEDLGESQEVYQITGIITGTDYIQNRDALIAALKSAGRGELVHPFFGSVQVTAKPYSLSENMTNLGIARFSMTFEKSDDSIYPNPSIVTGKHRTLRKSNSTIFFYIIPSKYFYCIFVFTKQVTFTYRCC